MPAIWKGAHPQNFRSGRPHGHRPEAIVIHIMDGSLTGTDSWFNDRRSGVSAHYGVGKDGKVHQYVKETDTAFHAGTVVRPAWPLLKPRVNPNFYTIGIEHEGFGGPGEDWPKKMFEASVALARDIAARWQIPADADHIVPHRAIRATKPNCPGGGIDLARYIDAVAAAAVAAARPPESRLKRSVRIVRHANIRPAPRTDNVRLRTLIAGDKFEAVAVVDGSEAVRVEAVDSALAVNGDTDQPGLAQRLEMLRHGRRRQREAAGQLARGLRPPAEQLDDPPAVRLGQSSERVHRRVN